MRIDHGRKLQFPGVIISMCLRPLDPLTPPVHQGQAPCRAKLPVGGGDRSFSQRERKRQKYMDLTVECGEAAWKAVIHLEEAGRWRSAGAAAVITKRPDEEAVKSSFRQIYVQWETNQQTSVCTVNTPECIPVIIKPDITGTTTLTWVNEALRQRIDLDHSSDFLLFSSHKIQLFSVRLPRRSHCLPFRYPLSLLDRKRQLEKIGGDVVKMAALWCEPITAAAVTARPVIPASPCASFFFPLSPSLMLSSTSHLCLLSFSPSSPFPASIPVCHAEAESYKEPAAAVCEHLLGLSWIMSQPRDEMLYENRSARISIIRLAGKGELSLYSWYSNR